MTTDDQSTPSTDADHPGAGHPGADRYGSDLGLGRNDPSLYGADAPGAPAGTDVRPDDTPAGDDTVEDVMRDASGVGPGGAGAMVAGASGGLMGAAADAAGAATLGSGDARGGMGAPAPDVDGNDAGVEDAVMPTAPGTAVSSGGPIAGSPAGSGPQTPAV